MFKELVLVHVSVTNLISTSVVQRKLSASPLSSPPTPGTTVIKKEKKKKKKKRELEEPQETEAVQGEPDVCMLCF